MDQVLFVFTLEHPIDLVSWSRFWARQKDTCTIISKKEEKNRWYATFFLLLLLLEKSIVSSWICFASLVSTAKNMILMEFQWRMWNLGKLKNTSPLGFHEGNVPWQMTFPTGYTCHAENLWRMWRCTVCISHGFVTNMENIFFPLDLSTFLTVFFMKNVHLLM